MKKIVALYFLPLLLFTQTIAQSNLPPVYKIRSDSIGNLPDIYQTKNVSRQVSMLEDYSGKLTIEQVMKPPFLFNFIPLQLKEIYN